MMEGLRRYGKGIARLGRANLDLGRAYLSGTLLKVESELNLQPGRATCEVTKPARGIRLALWSVYLVLLGLAIGSVLYGIRLRHDLYLWTDPIRFTGDINNAWYWGSAAEREGVVELYDRLVREQQGLDRPHYELDYPPVRLWLVTRWVKWAHAAFPQAQGWQRSYEFSQPMLIGNNIAELLSALAVFLIVRRQILVGRAEAAPPPGAGLRIRAVLAGFAGAMLLWFNAGMLFDAHAFPQWDMWIMPSFLFAVYAAMGRHFFTVGVLLGWGMLIKGQILAGALVLILWPAFLLDWRGVMALGMGMAAGTAALTWCWLVRGTGAHAFVVAIWLASLVVVLVWRRWQWLWLPFGLAGLAAYACVPMFNGSLSWWKVGFEYGTEKFPIMFSGGTSNLCTILQNRLGYGSPNAVVTVPLLGMMTLKRLMTIVFGICLVICGAGAARHFAARDRRLLVAMAAPFVLFYTVMPQMHDRYLVWGAAATALFAGVGVTMALVHLAITFIMWAAVMWNLTHMDPNWSVSTFQFLEAIHTGIAWMLMVLAGLLLHQAGPWPLLRRRKARVATGSAAANAVNVPAQEEVLGTDLPSSG